MIQKNTLKTNPREISFLIESVEAKKVSQNGEFNNWNPHADHVCRPRLDESTDSPVVTKMVSCPPCVWG
jgi:hypothetical protein